MTQGGGRFVTPAKERFGVLVVDDEPQILTAITDLLEEEFEVHTACDGLAALDILAVRTVCVILSDQRMPGMTGAEFLGRARSISDATRVLVTGYSDLDALVSAVNLGQIHAYLSKPWNPLELKVVVRTAADRWRLNRALDHERNLLRALMDNVPDAIFFKDRDLAFTRLNRPQAMILGGADPVDLLGMRLSDIVSVDQAGPVEALEQAIIDKGAVVDDVIESFIQADGSQGWISTTKAPIRMGGEVIGLVAETGCRYFSPTAFPDQIEAGVRVAHVGSSSVRYEIGLFRQGEVKAAATGHFVHVFVNRTTEKPTTIPAGIRACLVELIKAPQ